MIKTKTNLHSETIDIIVGGRVITLTHQEADKLEGKLHTANLEILNHRVKTARALTKAWKR